MNSSTNTPTTRRSLVFSVRTPQTTRKRSRIVAEEEDIVSVHSNLAQEKVSSAKVWKKRKSHGFGAIDQLNGSSSTSVGAPSPGERQRQITSQPGRPIVNASQRMVILGESSKDTLQERRKRSPIDDVTVLPGSANADAPVVDHPQKKSAGAPGDSFPCVSNKTHVLSSVSPREYAERRRSGSRFTRARLRTSPFPATRLSRRGLLFQEAIATPPTAVDENLVGKKPVEHTRMR